MNRYLLGIGLIAALSFAQGGEASSYNGMQFVESLRSMDAGEVKDAVVSLSSERIKALDYREKCELLEVLMCLERDAGDYADAKSGNEKAEVCDLKWLDEYLSSKSKEYKANFSMKDIKALRFSTYGDKVSLTMALQAGEGQYGGGEGVVVDKTKLGELLELISAGKLSGLNEMWVYFEKAGEEFSEAIISAMEEGRFSGLKTLGLDGEALLNESLKNKLHAAILAEKMPGLRRIRMDGDLDLLNEIAEKRLSENGFSVLKDIDFDKQELSDERRIQLARDCGLTVRGKYVFESDDKNLNTLCEVELLAAKWRLNK